MQGSGFFDIV